jgi:hypothetical protein
MLNRAKQALEHGPARSGAIMATASGVGLVAGKRGDMNRAPLAAVGTGVALNLLGFHTLGDGTLAGGLCLLGYKRGARSADVGGPSVAALAAPAPAPRQAPSAQKRR